MRAEEWLPSTPRHLQLFRALGFDPPEFAHLPMIVGPDRAKLSKRHGAASIWEYEEQGYLPDALLNFMVLLGWSLDDKTEIMSTDFLVENFELERVSKPAAIFDREKLVWMNGTYIRQLSTEDLARRVMFFLERELPQELLPVDWDYLLRIVPLVRERLKLLTDAPEMLAYFFQKDLEYDPARLVQRGMDRESTLSALGRAESELKHLDSLEPEALEGRFRAVGEELDLSPRQFFGALRVACTGRTATPPLFETMEVLGQERVLQRLKAASALLEDAVLE
jgi:glutamyl-tRNA synthetase